MKIDSYLEALLRSSTDLDGHPLDDDKGLIDVSAELRASSLADFQEFVRRVLCEAADELRAYLDKFDMNVVQQDFCLTRNHLGAGFWIRNHREGVCKFKKLTAIAESFPEVDPWIDPESGEIKA